MSAQSLTHPRVMQPAVLLQRPRQRGVAAAGARGLGGAAATQPEQRLALALSQQRRGLAGVLRAG